MTKIHLTEGQTRSIASLIIAASSDNVTPVLTGVHLTVTPTTVTAVASDRYIVAELTFPLEPNQDHEVPDEGASVLTPRADLAALAKIKDGYYLELSFKQPESDRESVSIEAAFPALARSVTFPSIGGRFPAIAKLLDGDFEEDLPNGMWMNMALIGKVARLTLPDEPSAASAARNAWKIQYRTRTDGAKKMSPVLLSRGVNGAKMRVLVQPHIGGES